MLGGNLFRGFFNVIKKTGKAGQDLSKASKNIKSSKFASFDDLKKFNFDKNNFPEDKEKEMTEISENIEKLG